MERFVSHVVRRGIEAHTAIKEKAPGSETIQLSGVGISVITSTVLVAIFLVAMINYTYGTLIATLIMVESPVADVFEPVLSDELAKGVLSEKVPTVDDLLVVKQKPITAKFRTAVKHLRSRGGRLAKFRGYGLHFFLGVAVTELSMVLTLLNVPQVISTLLAALTIARLQMAWTHIVISEPSNKYWYRRVPSLASWRKIAIPTVVAVISEEIAYGLPVIFYYALGLKNLHGRMASDLTCHERKLVILQFAAIFLLGVFASFALVIPSRVTLTRVHASMLPESDETIVPFDRTFGGHVGEDGVVSMLEAWKTFDWNSRIRLLKCYVKVWLMQVATILFAATCLGLEVRFFLGPENFAKLRSFGNLWSSQ